VESLNNRIFGDIGRAIIEAEGELQELKNISLSAEYRIKRHLTVLYDHLREVWPIVPGRGTKEEPPCR
jgi:hypothetical protein